MSRTISDATYVQSIDALLTSRFDYAGRTDTQPTYVGVATPGASDTDTASVDWMVKFFSYDGQSRVTSIKIATDVAWANRATLTYQ